MSRSVRPVHEHTFVYRKEKEQAEARVLRAQGESLGKIARALGVSKSSVSVWVRDVPVPVPEAPPPKPVCTHAGESYRRCARCEQRLPECAFNRYREGRQAWCRECFRAYFRARGQGHRDHCAANTRARVKLLRDCVFGHLRTHPCVDCGISDLVVLEFDHVGEKAFDIAAATGAGKPVPAVLAEMRRCEVVCCNCHRIRTYLRGAYWRTTPALRKPTNRPRERNESFVRDTLLASGCTDCGERRLEVLEFDHRGEKNANVSRLMAWNAALDRLKAEVALCDVVCANCHRKRTAKRAGWARFGWAAGGGLQ